MNYGVLCAVFVVAGLALFWVASIRTASNRGYAMAFAFACLLMAMYCGYFQIQVNQALPDLARHIEPYPNARLAATMSAQSQDVRLWILETGDRDKMVIAHYEMLAKSQGWILSRANDVTIELKKGNTAVTILVSTIGERTTILYQIKEGQ